MTLENSYDISIVGIRKLLLCVGKIIVHEADMIWNSGGQNDIYEQYGKLTYPI